MTLTISEVRPASAQEWDDAWSSSPTATFSMSRQWAELWASVSKGTLATSAKHVRFSDGKRAILPLVVARQHKGLLRDFEMCATGGYGAPLALDDLSPDHHRRLVAYLLSLGDIGWFTSPVDDSASLYVLPDARSQSTHLLPLNGPISTVLKRWSKGARAAVKQAQRAGVSIRLANGIQDWRLYYAVYQESRKRWGDRATSDHPWSIFSSLSQRDPLHVRLWLAELEGRVVAGALCLYGPRHVAYWHGAALEDAFSARPVNALMAEAIEHAVDAGYRWFDFGLSGGHEGVAAFKRGFGAEPVACYAVSRRTPASRLVKRMLSAALGG